MLINNWRCCADSNAAKIAAIPGTIQALVEMLRYNGKEDYASQVSAAKALRNIADNNGKQAGPDCLSSEHCFVGRNALAVLLLGVLCS